MVLNFAVMYNAFGSEVTVIVPDEQLLKNEDSDIAAEMSKDMAGQRHTTSCSRERAEHVKDDKNSITITLSGGKELSSDAVLFATGRRPNTENLGLEHTDISLTDSGAINVNSHLQTDVENVYALGDVKGGAQFTYTVIR